MDSSEYNVSWFAPEGTKLRIEIDRLDALRRRISDAAGESYQYTSIVQQQRNKARGYETTYTLPATAKMPPVARLELLELCSVAPYFQQFVVRSCLAVSAQLDAVYLLLERGRVLPAFLCLRSVIEHIALAEQTLRHCSLRVPINQDFSSLYKSLGTARAFLSNSAYGTRIGIKRFAVNPEPLRQRKKLKYVPQDGRVDLTAANIMNHIDEMGKRIKGLRSIYDVLSEFAHPNFGTQLAFTQEMSREPTIDSSGVWWKSSKIGSGKPTSFARDFERQLVEIIGCVSECVEELAIVIKECTTTRDNLFAATQVVARRQILDHRQIFMPYEPCPCRSGKKLRFCCGK
jgi:hypothetical protein